MVYASSAAVYGDVAALPITEAAPCRPLSAYGADKYGCELHARVASHRARHPDGGFALLQRLWTAAGPEIALFRRHLDLLRAHRRRASRSTIFGDGQQTRDFVYVGDVVAALLAAMALHASADAPVFNVCTGMPISVQALATLIADLAGQTLTVQAKPPRIGEIRHSIGDPGPANAALGLSGRTGLRDGLAQVVAWLAGQS